MKHVDDGKEQGMINMEGFEIMDGTATFFDFGLWSDTWLWNESRET